MKNKIGIIELLIRREREIMHTKSRFTRSGPSMRGYCQTISRNIIKDLIKDLRKERGEAV